MEQPTENTENELELVYGDNSSRRQDQGGQEQREGATSVEARQIPENRDDNNEISTYEQLHCESSREEATLAEDVLPEEAEAPAPQVLTITLQMELPVDDDEEQRTCCCGLVTKEGLADVLEDFCDDDDDDCCCSCCAWIVWSLAFGEPVERLRSLAVLVPPVVIMPVYVIRALVEDKDDVFWSWLAYASVGIVWVLTSYLCLLVVFAVGALMQPVLAYLWKLRKRNLRAEAARNARDIFCPVEVPDLDFVEGTIGVLFFGGASVGILFGASKVEEPTHQQDPTSLDLEWGWISLTTKIALCGLALICFLLSVWFATKRFIYPLYCLLCVKFRGGCKFQQGGNQSPTIANSMQS